MQASGPAREEESGWMAVTMKTVLEKEAIKNKSSPSPACWGEVELESASLLTVRKRAGHPLLSNTLTRSQYINVTNILTKYYSNKLQLVWSHLYTQGKDQTPNVP